MKSGKGRRKKPEELFRKHLGKKSLSLCRKILAKRKLCDNCLGRQFAQLSTGMTNAERGMIIRELLDTGGTAKDMKSQKKRLSNPIIGSTSSPKSTKCEICSGFFSSIQRWVDKAEEKLKPYEFKTFAVGTKPGSGITRKEEELWEEIGIEHCEPFRSESNREFGKALWKRIRKDVDEENPDMLVILDLGQSRAELDVRPVYVRGSYKKLVRGIPQTKWDMYPETVEDIIAKPFMKALEGKGHSLHAAGREDIDARCLDWRPFVLEIEQPKKRSADLKKMAAAINRTGKVEVHNLNPSDRKEVVRVKDMRLDKEYRMLVEFEEEPGEEKLKLLHELAGPIKQQTPSRVLHRRADLLRHKNVKSIKWRKVSARRYEIQIRGDAGLYAKEFVTGDGGRTKPSVAETLGIGARVLELDVIKIYAKDK